MGAPSKPGAAAKTELADTSRKPASRTLVRAFFMFLLWGAKGFRAPSQCVFSVAMSNKINVLLRFSEFEKTLFQNETAALPRGSKSNT